MLTGITHTLGYGSEQELVADFSGQLALGSPFRVDMMTSEFDYGSGRVDVIASRDGSVHAFEAKLSRWRDALIQATRATSFAEHVYVVIPHSIRSNALRYRQEFVRRGVGIITVDPYMGACLQLDAATNVPPLAWLADRAHLLMAETELTSR